MRSLVWMAVILLIAGGLYLLRSPEPGTTDIDVPPAPGRGADAAGVDADGRPLATTSTLRVRARTPDGRVPEGAEVGYEALHRERWVPAGAEGVRTFTDVPVGPLYVLARAPGHRTVRQRRVVSAGTTEEALAILRPTE